MVEQHCATEQPTPAEWRRHVISYETPSAARATWQLVNTVGPYTLLWWSMHHNLGGPWWLLALHAVLAGAFLVRAFVIFHDCGHGAFFRSRLANDLTGMVTGLLTFTPYYHWRWQHALHHGTSGNLDRRGMGDVWTMTVEEYVAATRRQRFLYRLSRNPLVLFFLAPLSLFLLQWRFASADAAAREKHSVWATNVAAAVIVTAMCFAFGVWNFLLLQLIVMLVAGGAGVWLFYVQHQFDDTYWERHEDWDYTDAALRGSSYFRLPALLRWLSGSIGYHHIHHLSTRVPNYRLKPCHESSRYFSGVKPVTLFGSIRCLTCHLWDEQRRRIVSFAHVHRGAKTATAEVAVRPGGSRDDDLGARRS